MIIGYARVSKFEQNLDLQSDALKNIGIEKIFVDRVSGVKSEKPQLEELLKFIRKGDTLTVWRLDRIGRTTVGLIKFVTELNEKGIHFKSITENIDTSSASGKLIFQIFCVLAEHERNVLIERTNAGLKSARARGKNGGRPKGMTEKYIKIAPVVKASYDAKELPVEEIMKAFNIGSKTTFYKIIQSQKRLKNMESRRYLEEDFNDFVKEIMDNKRFSDSKEEGIASLVIDKGFDSLSEKQKFVFEKAISYFVYDECSRCGNDIPWSEMSAAEDNGGMCSWCQQLSGHD